MLRKPFLLFFILLIIFLSACTPPEENPIPEQVFTTYETSAFSLHLPENYIGAEPNSPGLNVVVNWLNSNGYDAQGFSTFIQANASEILYVGINTDISLTNLLSYFTLAGGERPEDFTVDDFEQNYNETVGSETFISREQKEIGDKTVEVLLYEFAQGATSYRNSFYFLELEAENLLWKFEFVSPKPDYDEKIADFEHIIAEFEPRPGQ